MADYRLRPGTNIICDPGKFEGEPVYVPHYWEETLNGCCDSFHDNDGDYEVMVIRLDEHDRARIGADAKGEDHLLLWEDSQGFVNSRFVTDAQLLKLEAENEGVGELEDSEDDEVDESDEEDVEDADEL